MKIRMSINAKMLIYILSTSIIIFAFSVGFISYRTRQLALSDAEKLAMKVAAQNALEVEKDLSNKLSVLRTFAQAFKVYDEMEEQEWKDLFVKMYYKVYEYNPDFYKLWDSWELNQFDPTWTKDHGRYAVTVFKQNGMIKSSASLRSVDGENERYLRIKALSCDMLWEPYWDEFLEETETKKFMTSISSPIYRNGQFAGIVAADILMDKFQKIVTDIEPYKNTVAFLVSNQGVFVGHDNEKLIGENIKELYPEYEKQFQMMDLVKKGEAKVFRAKDNKGSKVLVALAPIQVGDDKAPWSLGLIIPIKPVLKEANTAQIISLLVAFIGIVVLTIVVLIISRNISRSLKKTTNILEKLSVGDIEGIDDLEISTGDEVEKMANSVNRLKEGLNKTSVFADHIGKGNLDAAFEPLGDNDVLGNSLLEMRKSLKHAEEEELKRKIEDDKMNWATQGLAKFSEILRTNSNNIEELSFNIMRNLINYLDVNQGALFVVDDTDESQIEFELKSAIAYGRDKYLKKRVGIGEELVGRCAFEKKTIYMTDIPKDYIQITSGMGTANPSSLLLVPLILNEETFGVIELASFHPIEKYKIDFVEKLGESIASTVASVKVNERTTKLLGQSKQQAEELAAQEEEMRQNLEELQATQEEAARREFETTGIINALGNSAFMVEYDLEGTILSCNAKYADMLGLSQEQIIGQKHSSGYDFTPEMRANYNLFWGDLRRGISKKEINKIHLNGRDFWVDETYTPIINMHEDKTYKILKIGFDITEQKLKEQKLKEQEEKLIEENKLLADYQLKIEQLQQKVSELQKKPAEVSTSSPSIASVETKRADSKIVSSGDNLLDWVPEFRLDIAEMDEQHQQLIHLANQMFASFKLDKNKKEIKDNLRSFVDFASYHFGNEENYFEQFGLQSAKDHLLEHKQFIKEITQFQTDYAANKVKFLDGTMNFIKNWLHQHFTGTDRDYISLFKENGL
ncbi:MAG TPA: hypothetical protein DCQ26_04165 [Marinilabiliales bacterium]|nr:MAG: hypothetical protein A2W95_03275 [Bacteroidetes bacterium GWA2_40_14]OFX58085.1 MAG: hypothetical protein A2W84_08950 [Bacteroidetes bacterium GWC2_40_13]OFX91353.1 MAG: hypothetical protein A2W97_03880 [Bacteroidetes bacterium GWE2_40_63]OFZ25573.1 MAG: hypothetical protein A2437_12165 [Bacteroidetes bacterium RIFOXYC2_FULL_40_12]HAM97783.1 hypothetical protein [Marinilabiliales bacterium]